MNLVIEFVTFNIMQLMFAKPSIENYASIFYTVFHVVAYSIPIYEFLYLAVTPAQIGEWHHRLFPCTLRVL